MGDASESDYSYVITERDFISLLIDLYRDRPELWKVKHQGYLDKPTRALALEGIVKELKIYKPDFSVADVKKKINILRTNYNKERHKIDAARRNGVEDVKPGLWYFNELLFLSEQDNNIQIGSRLSDATADTGELSDPGDHKYADSDIQSDTPRQSQQIHKKVFHKKVAVKRPRTEPDIENDVDSDPEQYMTVTTTYYKKKKTKEDILAKTWALKLKKMAPHQKIYAEKIINDVLFEGELGNLTKNGVSFCPSF